MKSLISYKLTMSIVLFLLANSVFLNLHSYKSLDIKEINLYTSIADQECIKSEINEIIDETEKRRFVRNLSVRKRENTPWDSKENIIMDKCGVKISLNTILFCDNIEISLDNNDDYLLSFMSGKTELASLITLKTGGMGLSIRSVDIPDIVQQKGFDKIRIIPFEGDNYYSMGHILRRSYYAKTTKIGTAVIELLLLFSLFFVYLTIEEKLLAHIINKIGVSIYSFVSNISNIFVSLVFITLIYSTGLHYALGPEHSIELNSLIIGNIRGVNPTVITDSELSERNNLDNFWQYSPSMLDCEAYINQSRDLSKGSAPFKYRILPVLLVRIIHWITNLSLQKSFTILNISMIFMTAHLFLWFLYRDFGFSYFLSFLGSILFITMLANTRTVSFPYVEPTVHFFVLLIFIALRRINLVLFLFSSILGVMAKEVIILFGILWFFVTYERKRKMRSILPSFIPFLVFSIIRKAMGGSPFEVSYGYDVLNGNFPWMHMKEWISNPDGFFYRVFSSFLFLWLGLINIVKDKFLMKSSIIVPLMLIAIFFLSYKIARPLGVLYPIIIPSFLIYFKHVNPGYSLTNPDDTRFRN